MYKIWSASSSIFIVPFGCKGSEGRKQVEKFTIDSFFEACSPTGFNSYKETVSSDIVMQTYRKKLEMV